MIWGENVAKHERPRWRMMMVVELEDGHLVAFVHKQKHQLMIL